MVKSHHLNYKRTTTNIKDTQEKELIHKDNH